MSVVSSVRLFPFAASKKILKAAKEAHTPLRLKPAEFVYGFVVVVGSVELVVYTSAFPNKDGGIMLYKFLLTAGKGDPVVVHRVFSQNLEAIGKAILEFITSGVAFVALHPEVRKSVPIVFLKGADELPIEKSAA